MFEGGTIKKYFLIFSIIAFTSVSFFSQQLYSLADWISHNDVLYEVAQLEHLEPEDMGDDYELLDQNGDGTILVIKKDGKLYVVELE